MVLALLIFLILLLILILIPARRFEIRMEFQLQMARCSYGA